MFSFHRIINRFGLLLFFLFEYFVSTDTKFVPPPSSKIVNGKRAEEGEFPYIVGVFAKDYMKRRNFGRGSILAGKWIISSRHVAYNDDYLVHSSNGFLGKIYENELAISPNYDNTLDTLHNGPKYLVEKRFCYPKVNDKTDFVILKLTKAIPLDSSGSGKFSTIPIADLNNEAKEIIAAGWGSYDGQINLPANYLMKAQLNVVEKNDQSLTVNENGKSICFGDSGGPGVIRNNETSTDELIGIAAYVNDKYCKKNSVFIYLPPFKSWIQNVMNNESSQYECDNIFGPNIVKSNATYNKWSQLTSFSIALIFIRAFLI